MKNNFFSQKPIVTNISLRSIEPLYKARVSCSMFGQAGQTLDCGHLNYTLVFSSDRLNSSRHFMIDQSTAYVYATYTNVVGTSSYGSSFILLITSSLADGSLLGSQDRFVRSAQTYLTIAPSPVLDETRTIAFERSSYTVRILNAAPTGTIILGLKYKYSYDHPRVI